MILPIYKPNTNDAGRCRVETKVKLKKNYRKGNHAC